MRKVAVAALATAFVAAAPSEPPTPLQLARTVLSSGCPAHRAAGVVSYPWSRLACDAFAGSALVSASLDLEPTHRAEAAGVVDSLIDDLLQPATQQPFRSTGFLEAGGARMPRSVLYRGMLLFLITGRERLSSGSPHQALGDAMATVLARDLAASRTGLLATYGTDLIWPCDHAPAASALLLHGALRGNAASTAAGERLVATLRSLSQRRAGLPTQLKPSGAAVEPLPRGTVLGWTAGFLLHADADAAAEHARSLFEGFCDHLPAAGSMAGCREWPRGVHRAPDAVGGPDMFGYSTGATALALAAGRALPSEPWAQDLERTAAAFGMPLLLARPTEFGFEDSIYLWATTARSWLPSPKADSRPNLPSRQAEPAVRDAAHE